MAVLLSEIINSLNFMIFIFFSTPFVITLVIMPYFIKKFKKKRFVAKDMYKPELPEVATNGGIIILMVSILSLSIISLFYCNYIDSANYIIITVVTLFALFGILDDMINIGRVAKLIVLYYCSYSLIACTTVTSIYTPFYGFIDFGILYVQLILPFYILVVANLMNMHSGFNGLAPGLSLIILIALLIKTFLYGQVEPVLFIICLTGSLAAYWFFENYPAKIFWGNIGALATGAAIGSTIVIEGFLFSGFIMLIPHIINFLLFIYLIIDSKKNPPLKKFGKVRSDGTIEVPNRLTLKWILPYYIPLTEKQATNIMYIVTIIFCIIGLVIPG